MAERRQCRSSHDDTSSGIYAGNVGRVNAGQSVLLMSLPHRSIFRRFTGEWSGIGYRLRIHHADTFGRLYPPTDKQRIDHGDRFLTAIALNEPSALEVSQRCGTGRLLGQGVITEVINLRSDSSHMASPLGATHFTRVPGHELLVGISSYRLERCMLL